MSSSPETESKDAPVSDFKVVDQTVGEAHQDRFWIRLNPGFAQPLGLPTSHSYPVFAKALGFESLEETRLSHLLWGLMRYLELKPETREKYEPAMLKLSEVLSRLLQGSRLSGQTWSFRYAPVDLEGEIVTVQQKERLMAAIENDSGGLRVSCYRMPCLRTARCLAGLSSNPGPDGTVAMRENNWEFTLDQSAPGMGKYMAAEAGRSYLSYWGQGLGRSDDGQLIPEWHKQRASRPLPIEGWTPRCAPWSGTGTAWASTDAPST